jgi:hypothetical protein
MTPVIQSGQPAALDYITGEKHFKKSPQKEKTMKNEKTLKTIPIPIFFPIDLQKQIAEMAYYRWLERGLPTEGAEQDWLEAESEVLDSLRETEK